MEQGITGNKGVLTAESHTALEVVPAAESPVTNEGVPTAESTNALEVVPTAELPVTNEDVQTNVSPTKVVGEPTAESSTLLKYCDKRAIHINSRNLLVASGHIEN